MFVSYSRQPVVGALLWGSFVRYASVIDNPNIAFVLVGLSCMYGTLVISWWITRSLVVSWDALIAVLFLSAISCKVTWFPTEETCEDFPLSVLLDGSSWISPFSASSYSLFISISAREEIFCLGYSGTRPSRGSIHCVWVLLEHTLFVGRLPLLSTVRTLRVVGCFIRCTCTSCWGEHW
jgi:hypothetical protein